MVELLCAYKFGSKEGLDKFNRLDLSNVGNLRIAVFGQTGSGKSAFISTCERTLMDSKMGTAPIQTLGGEGTVLLEDYLTGLPFQLVDTRGFFSYDENEKNEILNILNGHLKSGDFIQRDSPNPVYKAASPILQRRIHAVIIIVRGDDVRLNTEVYKQNFEFLRLYLFKKGIAPITVVTHVDKLTDAAAQEAALQKAAIMAGTTLSNTFGIHNYISDETKRATTEQSVVDILNCALRSAELFIRNIKLNERFKTSF